MRARRLAESVWTWLGEDRRLIYLLAALLVIYGLMLVLPQAPVSSEDTATFARWLAELYPVLGEWTQPLASSGLLSMRTSLWMRLFLTMLLLVIVVRSSILKETWRVLSVRSRWFYSFVCTGGMLFIIGWGAHTLWGWTETDIIAWPDSPVKVAGRELPAPPVAGAPRLWNGVYGLYLLPDGKGIGLEMQAFDVQQAPLMFSLSTRSGSQETLRLALTSQVPEAYFALSDPGLIFRISEPQAAESAGVLLQVYRSASGELRISETLAADYTLSVDDVSVYFRYYSLPRFVAVNNPGAPLQILGVLLFVIGTVAQVWISKHPQDETVEQ